LPAAVGALLAPMFSIGRGARAHRERVTLNRHAIGMSGPQSPQFYEHFVAMVSRRLKENARETRAALSELVGGEVGFLPTDGLQELVVRCALSTTMLPVA